MPIKVTPVNCWQFYVACTRNTSHQVLLKPVLTALLEKISTK